ncbi:hypothetical protein ACFYO1_43065 [Nocardia sp. NPDC006044]|uniref:hypothetical protein n=1 Tax=Nocardia sp. NPDC006044 TaxID=3364306 RepID=UPI0036BB9542
MATITACTPTINQVGTNKTIITVDGDRQVPVTSSATSFVSGPSSVELQARLIDNHPAFALSICLAVAIAVIIGLITGIAHRVDGSTFAAAFIRGGSAAGYTLVGGAAVITLITLMS